MSEKNERCMLDLTLRKQGDMSISPRYYSLIVFSLTLQKRPGHACRNCSATMMRLDRWAQRYSTALGSLPGSSAFTRQQMSTLFVSYSTHTLALYRTDTDTRRPVSKKND